MRTIAERQNFLLPPCVWTAVYAGRCARRITRTVVIRSECGGVVNLKAVWR